MDNIVSCRYHYYHYGHFVEFITNTTYLPFIKKEENIIMELFLNSTIHFL